MLFHKDAINIIYSFITSLFKSRIVLISIFIFSIYIDIIISQNATLLWYPHNEEEVWLNLLFGLSMLVGAIAFRSYLSLSRKSGIIIFILKYIINICVYVGKILVIAVIFQECSRQYRIRWYMIQWVLSLLFAILFLLYFPGGYLTPRRNIHQRKKKTKNGSV